MSFISSTVRVSLPLLSTCDIGWLGEAAGVGTRLSDGIRFDGINGEARLGDEADEVILESAARGKLDVVGKGFAVVLSCQTRKEAQVTAYVRAGEVKVGKRGQEEGRKGGIECENVVSEGVADACS